MTSSSGPWKPISSGHSVNRPAITLSFPNDPASAFDRTVEEVAHHVGGPAVGGGDGVGVDGQGRGGGGVAEAFADRSDWDASVEEACRDVVPQIVQADGVESDLLPQAQEAAGGAGVGPPRHLAGNVAGKDIGIAGEVGLADLGAVLHPGALLLEGFHRSGVEGDPPAPVGLRLLLHYSVGAERQGPGNEDLA